MNKIRQITVQAPASVANVSCGYDIMGFALNQTGDCATITVYEEHVKVEQQLVITGKYGALIPTNPLKNTASVAVRAYLKHLDKESLNYSITLEKSLPLGSGLGSSASSAVAAVVAMNTILGNLLETTDLLPFVMEGERVACGAAHADNVAPSLLGGFTLIRSYNPLDVVAIKCPDQLFAVVIHPQVELNTADARRILPSEFTLEEAVSQSANVAGFVLGLVTNNLSLLARSMYDGLAEPKRQQLLPEFQKVKQLALDSGALGFGISGSGPSVFALCEGAIMASKVEKSISAYYRQIGLETEAYISTLNAPGARIIKHNNHQYLKRTDYAIL